MHDKISLAPILLMYLAIYPLARSLCSLTGSFVFSSHHLSLILLLSSSSFPFFYSSILIKNSSSFFLSTNKKFIIIFFHSTIFIAYLQIFKEQLIEFKILQSVFAHTIYISVLNQKSKPLRLA